MYVCSLLAVLAFSACSSDDDNETKTPVTNDNKNVVSANLPQEITRLEFPKVKGDANNVVLVRKTDQYGVNYCKGAYQAIGFWFEHRGDYPSSESLKAHVVNIKKLEELTGLDFFCNLPDYIEKRVESAPYNPNTLSSKWGF